MTDESQVKVPCGELSYSWNYGPHYLVDDYGNIVGCFSEIKELSLSEQKFVTISNIRWYTEVIK